MATHRVFTCSSTASIPPRRKSMCGTHHGSITSPVSPAPSPSTLPSFAHASHTGFPSGPETHLLFPLPETLVPRFFHGLHLTSKVTFLACKLDPLSQSPLVSGFSPPWHFLQFVIMHSFLSYLLSATPAPSQKTDPQREGPTLYPRFPAQ